jgi:hypothetical protein
MKESVDGTTDNSASLEMKISESLSIDIRLPLENHRRMNVDLRRVVQSDQCDSIDDRNLVQDTETTESYHTTAIQSYMQKHLPV